MKNKVGYTRRNMFVSVLKIINFEVFNLELLALCNADFD
jgi:hypothetical protein